MQARRRREIRGGGADIGGPGARPGLQWFVLAALFVLPAFTVAAQPTLPSNAEKCALPRATADSIELLVWLRLETAAPVIEGVWRGRIPRVDLGVVTQQIQQYIVPPAVIGLSVDSSTIIDTSRHFPGFRGFPLVRSMVAFTLHDDGNVNDLRLEQPSSIPELDSMLISAVLAAQRERALARTFVESNADSMRLWLSIEHAPDSSRAIVSPLFTLRLPSFLVVPPAGAKGSIGPRYPDAARVAGRGDSVDVSFVVTQQGRADLSTLRIHHARHFEFVRAVVEAMPRMRFQPALINGCPQDVLIRSPFTFKIVR
jgi:TonB family protein